ncbi:S49 family peptidase, partial [Candidatus Pacearchaeota archaeon]|nr:S49 family peptidase [Candidatus Pacearchaeota archaeon]
DLTQINADLGMDFGNSYEVRRRGGAALIPISGTISRKMNLFSQISGGTSIDFLQRDISAALKDDSIEEIHLIVDSPGGTVNGTKELADFIYASRGKKPIKAFVEGEGMSAAYWIASAADEVIGFPTAMVGSIGVIMQHTDVSERNKADGIKKKAIFAGKYKNAATSHEPLTAESEAYFQDMVDKMYVSFVEGVAQNRGVEVSVVLEKMADAKIFVAQDALDAGLIDRIGTWEEFFTSSNGNSTGFDASADTSGLSAHSNTDGKNLVPNAAFTHNNTETDGEPAWSVIDKTKLPRNAHAETGKPDQKSTWKYPHHWIKGGEVVDASGIYTGGDMYLHKGGLSFAWGAANGARSGQQASASVKSHLKTHRSAAGMSADWDSSAWEVEAESIFADDFSSVFEGWSFLTENKNNKEECSMDINKLRTEHNALFKEVCAVAREGYIAVDASTALHSDLTAQA